MKRTSLQFNLISAVLAFVLWGSWAWHVNTQTGSATGASPLVSAVTQGTGSFIITLVMVHIVAWLYHRFSNSSYSMILPTLITVIFTGSCMAIAHYFVGTPDILRTIAPGMTVAVFFNLFTTYKLSRTQP